MADDDPLRSDLRSGPRPVPFRESGYTAVELVITIAMLSVVSLGVTIVFIQSAGIYSEVTGRSVAVQRMDQLTDFLEREVKNVRDQNSILIATSSQFKFVNTSGATIDLTYANQQMKKNNTAVAVGISGFSLSYSKWDGSAWTGLPTSSIARVNYQASFEFGQVSSTFQGAIVLRNCR
jgi:FlaG/FlaF family flagellin (archaellin)